MAIYIEEYKLLFSLSPRTASTTTANVLKAKLARGKGFRNVPPANIPASAGTKGVDKKHSKFAEIDRLELLPPEAFAEATRVTTVRNPFDSVYSAWFKKAYTYQPLIDQPDTFIHRQPGYLEDMARALELGFADWFLEKMRPKAENGTPANVNWAWARGATLLLKFENLQDDFAQMLDQLGVSEPFEVPFSNKTEGKTKSYRDAYTDEARAVGEKVFARELSRFGYSFDGIAAAA